MIEPVVTAALLVIGTSMALVIVRLVRGPTTIDRVLALDTLAMNFIALLVILSIRLQSELYFEGALVLAVLAFVGTVSISKYLMRGRIIE